MQNLSDIKTVKRILSKYGFTFSKAMGQNFLCDPSVCPDMADMSGIEKGWAAIEIGPGIGVLTAELAKRADKVIAIELDKRLQPVLSETLSEFDNVEVIFEDCMKVDLHALIAEKLSGKKIAVCANLPYYITSPIIMMLLEQKLPIECITAMVQKEAGERICAKVGSRDSGAVTVAVNHYADADILFDVGRECFIPSPNVDSCVIKLDVRKEPQFKIENEKLFFSLIKSGFSQRRKTISNSLLAGSGIGKERLNNAIINAGLKLNDRIEGLDMESLCRLSNEISKEIKK